MNERNEKAQKGKEGNMCHSAGVTLALGFRSTRGVVGVPGLWGCQEVRILLHCKHVGRDAVLEKDSSLIGLGQNAWRSVLRQG